MNLDKFEKGPREIFHPEIQKVKEAVGFTAVRGLSLSLPGW